MLIRFLSFTRFHEGFFLLFFGGSKRDESDKAKFSNVDMEKIGLSQISVEKEEKKNEEKRKERNLINLSQLNIKRAKSNFSHEISKHKQNHVFRQRLFRFSSLACVSFFYRSMYKMWRGIFAAIMWFSDIGEKGFNKATFDDRLYRWARWMAETFSDIIQCDFLFDFQRDCSIAPKTWCRSK